jgi:regulatory protein
LKKKPDPRDGQPPDANEIRSRAIALLARREHSALELKRKLLQRGYSPDLIIPVLQALAAEGLLSETRYAQEWVRSRVSRGQGPLKIRAELRQQGLADAQIEQVLAESDTDWGRLARSVRNKRFGTAMPNGLTDRARQMRFLESRGFASDHIRQALGADPND